MSDAKVHRRRALRCLALADKITDPVRKAKAVDLAVKSAARAQEAAEPRNPIVQQQQQVQSDNVDC